MNLKWSQINTNILTCMAIVEMNNALYKIEGENFNACNTRDRN